MFATGRHWIDGNPFVLPARELRMELSLYHEKELKLTLDHIAPLYLAGIDHRSRLWHTDGR